MTPVSASRVLFIGFSLITLVVMILALGPFGNHAATGFMLPLMLSPFLAIWAVGPYAVTHRFTTEGEGPAVWAFPGLQVVSGIAGLAMYAYELFIAPAADLNAMWVFVTVPVYQFIAVIAVYYVVRPRHDSNAAEPPVNE